MVSIILINYNGYKDTCELIASWKTYETYPYELIIVDNNSRDKQGERLKKEFPEYTVICSNKNLGFAQGNNLGIQYAKGDYLFILNNDTQISKPVLQNMVDVLEQKPSIGCVSPKITFYPNTSLIQYAGASEMSSFTLRNNFIGYATLDKGQYETPQQTAFAHGAAMMVRKKDLDIYGLMFDAYFLYYEELDWNVQMKKHGFGVWYEPTAVINHKESASVGVRSPLQVFYHTRNRFVFAHHTIEKRGSRSLSYFYQLFVAVPKRFFVFFLRGEFSLAKALLKGAVAGISYILEHKQSEYSNVNKH
ncbi:MAG: glycosyltransferase family 2 protein [Bacteroidaceae bacterium]